MAASRLVSRAASPDHGIRTACSYFMPVSNFNVKKITSFTLHAVFINV